MSNIFYLLILLSQAILTACIITAVKFTVRNYSYFTGVVAGFDGEPQTHVRSVPRLRIDKTEMIQTRR